MPADTSSSLNTSLASLNISEDNNPTNLSKSKLNRLKKKAATTSSSSSASKKNKSGTSTPTNTEDIDNSTSNDVEITAISQQSRFHRETFDANSTDIDIKGVNISITNSKTGAIKEILVDAHLRLKTGVRYGMVGQNGVGKSVLMHVLGNDLLVGLPQNVKFLHIKQLEEFAEGRSILAEVLSADEDRERVIREAQALQNTNTTSFSELAKTIHTILVARSSSSLDRAQKTATLRSGQRGHTARQALLAAEAQHANILSFTDNPEGYVTEDMANEVMTDVYKRFEEEIGADAEEGVRRAEAILKGLGFADEEMRVEGGKGIGELSGGWRMRVVLAKALFVKPDILLLDEPTNHLDLPAILWLQEYLLKQTSEQGQTIVVVSHDRQFLDTVTEETIIFKDKSLKYHNGNYEDWEKNTEEQRKRKTRLKELEMKRKKQIMSSIQKNVAQAKSTGDDKRLGMVASRKKKLERMGMQKLEDGKRFQMSKHGYYREEITIETGFKTQPILLPPPEPFNFPGKTFLQLSEVSFKYPGRNSKLVINKVSLDVGPGARIGLLGPNGCGKSTLMNLLAGELKPTLGEVKAHHRLRIGYFSQHTVDRLSLHLTPLQQLAASYPDVTISETEARTHFGSVGALVCVSHDVWFLKQVIEEQDNDEEDEEDGEEEKEGVLYRVTKQGELRMWTDGLDTARLCA
ncbi:hypothetical protein NP233_g1914 [Leucocoprinus birnbaumii]|uniref:ABC transporter domain-containing protein n=1 Tax=Leucocoprinus birnbaumii TaxID=56174 RepID=A0AAD5W548_9AGAR|nr:hypothetical protein NP233_g1914 [Leucocoprinus birnbaumii]